MNRLVRSAVVALACAPAAFAQSPIQLKSPGAGFLQMQFQNSSIANWAGQMANETAQLQALIAQLPVAPFVKQPLIQSAAVAVRETAEVHRLALANTRRDVLYRQHQQADAACTNLVALVQRSGIVSRDLAQAVSRVQFADEQLEQAFANIQPGDDLAWRRRVGRMATVLADQAGELRALADDSLTGFDRTLDRAIRTYAYGSAGIEQNITDGASRDKITVDVTDLDRRWQTVTVGLTGSATANAAVRAQAARVDGLHRNFVAFVTGNAAGPGLPGWGIVPRGSAFAVGAGESGGPRVRIFFDVNGGQSTDFFAYDPAFRGGVRVAMADLTGDAVPDIVTAPGPGLMPLVRVYDGRTLALVVEFLAYDRRMVGGVHVAAAGLNRRGQAIVVTGADVGGTPHVRVFDLATGKTTDDFMAYSQNFLGGVRVALGDVNGDGTPDLITAPGPSQPGSDQIGPVVRVLDGRNRKAIAEFNAYDPRWTNGVWLATGDIRRDGRAEIVTGADAGGGPHVRVFDGQTAQHLADVYPFPMQFNGGVRVAAHDVNGDGVLDFLCAPGPSAAFVAPPVRILDGRTKRPLGEFRPFEPTFRGGVFLGAK
jgi:hypothetical protein